MTSLDLQTLTARFVDAQLHGDRRAALALIVDGLTAGVPVVDLQGKVVAAAQEEIGRLWQQNHISIAQEHLATGISQLALAHLFEHAPRVAPNGKRVHVACVQGELHDLPARLVADYVEHQGFGVRYFGPDVPTEDLVRAVEEGPPDVLALSITMSFHVAALRTAVTAVREVAPSLPVVVGGHAVRWAPNLVSELGVRTAPSTAADLVAAMRRLTGLEPS